MVAALVALLCWCKIKYHFIVVFWIMDFPELYEVLQAVSVVGDAFHGVGFCLLKFSEMIGCSFDIRSCHDGDSAG